MSAPTTRRAASTGPRSRTPTLRAERALLREGHVLVAGMDEVGRGALAGPVSVGVAVVDAGTPTAPVGLRDSKLLSPDAREVLAPRVRRWALACAVGHASAGEVDALGVVRALRLAGRRALAGLGLEPGVVVLDGSHDWLSTPRPRGAARADAWAVRTQVKADLRCAAVAAASVVAKTERDALMRDLGSADPRYGWVGNKGYSAPDHLAALRRHGPGVQHRRSWRLPLQAAPADVPARGGEDAAGPREAGAEGPGRRPTVPPLSGRMVADQPVHAPGRSGWEGRHE
ncbi:ribonuclease HII [Pseudokineococcus basanitobsidens]|uniref:Ribonuclease n=1 Tax=Pseudokineococcus basanitobsidens TaxID=1926649 RepID=A0ABU8RJT1_9ACTN